MVLILFVDRCSVEIVKKDFAVVISKVTHYGCANLAESYAVSPSCSDECK